MYQTGYCFFHSKGIQKIQKSWNKVVRIMKYLIHQKDYKITYNSEGENNDFADADFDYL